MEFLDTYALVELAIGNRAIEVSDETVTLDINLAELYYTLLRIYDAETADRTHAFFAGIAITLTQEIIPEAMRFRFSERKNNLSYADALGYVYAQHKGIPFVTGDRAFKGRKGVRMIG